MKLLRQLVIAALAVLVCTQPSKAHHSTNLGYDAKRTETISGEFVDFRWINPHAILRFKATNSKGEKELWAAETHGAGVLGRFGWRPTMFKPGERITLTGNPARKAGSKTFHVLSVKAEDGKTYSVNHGSGTEGSARF